MTPVQGCPNVPRIMSSRSPASFDFTALADRLAGAAVFADWGRAFPARVDSTNRLALDLARNRLEAGLPPNSVAVAGEQTAGTGRRGRPWQSAAGAGLWFSLVVPPPGAAPAAPPAIVLAGGLAEVFREAGVPVGVKWPNDLFLGGGKVGGLLMTGLTVDGARLWRAGVGVNWRPPPRDLPDEYQAEGIAGWLGSAEASLALAEALVETAVRVLQHPEGWEATMASLRRSHWLYGRSVRVETEGGRCFRARAGDLRPDGRLELSLSSGERRVSGPNDRVRPLDGTDEAKT